ncbi:DNA polymerase I [Natrarchaeobaculum aegyptiacum]|uniref:DNA-directed DNA polymerase n=1 Tax=Natrarchaeobaculum aegyptiacum TaxID=745377 RepID=A0A2Z2HWF2_9EURY|nr:DNA polymerase I [Natrarchaeobaculum aegyptiacum]
MTPGPYTLEFEDDRVREWYLTDVGVDSRLVTDYAPSVFVAGPEAALEDLRTRLEVDPKVVETGFERWAADLHEAHVGERSRLLRADCERVGEVRTLAREIRGVHERETFAPGTFRLFDVDLAPGFRYCLDRGLDPTPARELRTLEIGLEEPALSNGDVSALTIDGEPALERRRGHTSATSGAGERDDVAALESLQTTLERRDPDVLVVGHADLIPLLDGRASELELEGFRLGRLPGVTQLAGENTFESYGRVGHSPARYRVPGRAIVDTANSFLWHQSGLGGIEYMVERTGRPLQEAAWGSIGTLLTSRQIRLARREWGVLAPWNKWEPERFTDVRTLHAADRGGFAFSPQVGFHEDVHEIDFGSLYPRIICQHNVSPETVDCRPLEGDDSVAGDDAGGDDHETIRETVPDLGYRICDQSGFLPEVLEPLLADRARCKRRLAADPPEDVAARLRAESGAIKWVLVSCFGYQGYRNAKYGRIECHEAINAYAREIALEAKRRLEDAGWRIVHGLVDSFWVTPREDVDEPEPLSTVVDEISQAVGIPLEHDGRYEWCSFVPLSDSVGRDREGVGSEPDTEPDPGTAGALTKYVGKRTDGTYKFRGIACRRRSTPAFVADCQRAFVETLDRERDPEAVCDVLERRLATLRRGAVDPETLVISTRATRRLADYRSRTRTVAALERYAAQGIDRYPGQSVRYVVTDDDARGRERVRLEFEEPTEYDAAFYATLLIRACEEVISPLGWDRARIRRSLRDGRTVRLSTFLE